MNAFKQAYIDQGINIGIDQGIGQGIKIGEQNRIQKDLDRLTKYFMREDKNLTVEEAKNKAQAILNFE